MYQYLTPVVKGHTCTWILSDTEPALGPRGRLIRSRLHRAVGARFPQVHRSQLTNERGLYANGNTPLWV